MTLHRTFVSIVCGIALAGCAQQAARNFAPQIAAPYGAGRLPLGRAHAALANAKGGGFWVSYQENSGQGGLKYVPWPYVKVTKTVRAKNLVNPELVVVNSEGQVAVTQPCCVASQNLLLIFSKTGKLAATVTIPGSQMPLGLAFDRKNNLFALDNDPDSSSKLDLLEIKQPYASKPKQIGSIPWSYNNLCALQSYNCALLADRNGNVIVADQPANAVYLFLAPAYRRTTLAKIKQPVSLALDKRGNLYVGVEQPDSQSQPEKYYVQQFSAKGQTYHSSKRFLLSTLPPGPTSKVEHIIVDPHEDLVTGSFGGCCNPAFALFPDGSAKAKAMQYDGLYEPVGMALDKGGNLIIANISGANSSDSSGDIIAYAYPFPTLGSNGSWYTLQLSSITVQGLAYYCGSATCFSP